MALIYGQLVKAQLENLASDPTSTPTGIIYFNTATNILKWYDSSAWRTAVDTNSSQQLTNKDYDGGTASNSSRITLPKAAKATLDGLTRKEATLVYASDQKKVFADDGSTLQEIGSGGGGSFNYVSNPDAEVDASTGVTVANFTSVTRGTTESTFSDSYFILTTGTSGSTCTVDWDLDTLHEKHDGQLMRFSMRVHGSSAVDTYKIGVHDGTSYVSGTEFTLANGALLPYEAIFTLDRTATYTVRLERTSGTTDETLYIDDITVSPEQVVIGNPGEDNAAINYTVSAGFGTIASDTVRFERHGAYLICYGQWTNGTVSGTTAYIDLDDLNIDTSNLVAGTRGQNVGEWWRLSGSATTSYASGQGGPAFVDPSTASNRIYFTRTLNASKEFNKDGVSTIMGSTDGFAFRFEVPIAEWAGSSTFGANSRVEYASNNSTATTDDDTTSNVVRGPSGALLGFSSTPAGARFRRRVTFQTSIQPTDTLKLQISSDGNLWRDYIGGTNDSASGSTVTVDTMRYDGTNFIGIGLSSDDDVDANSVFVEFGKYATGSTTAWNADSGNLYYRVVKSSNPLGIGAGLVTSEQPGAMPADTVDLSDAIAAKYGLKQYESVADSISVTSSYTGTLNRAVFVPYQVNDGTWRCKINIDFNITTPTGSNGTITIGGITFKNFSPGYQSFSTYETTGSAIYAAATIANTDDIQIAILSGSVNIIALNGDVELESKPTWVD